MQKKIKTLIIDDSETDAVLLVRELRRGGFEPEFRRVDTAEGLNTALNTGAWDAVICDYKMPQFDGFSALRLFKQRQIDIPFIVVSGMIGEEIAVSMMKAGAHDYLLKDNLARLVPALERELREAIEREEHRRAEKARSHLAAIVASSEDAIISTTLDGSILSWNAGAEKTFGYTSDEMKDSEISRLAPIQLRSESGDLMHKIVCGQKVLRHFTQRLRKDGALIHISLTMSPILDSEKNIIGVSTIARDITDLRKAEAERERLLAELQKALAEIKTLSGLLPICAGCKRIRDDGGYWEQVEIYLKRYSNAQFTHGLCPHCIHELYPEYAHDVQDILEGQNRLRPNLDPKID
jgi:PAS domain S-box-containing protein